MSKLNYFGEIVIPVKLRNKFKRLAHKAGYDTIFDSVAIIFIASVLLAITFIAGFTYYIEGNDTFTLVLLFSAGILISFLVIFIFLMVVYVLFLDYKAYLRMRFMEEMLPDFFMQFSENIKSGLTLDQSLARSIRPEQGVIYEEMNLVVKNIMTGAEVSDALRKFLDLYDSETLRRNFSLVIEAIEGGGKVGEVIDSIIEELRQTKKLRDEMTTSVLNYIIFISMIVIFIAPALFAASRELLILMGNFVESLLRSSSRLPISIKKVSITPDDFTFFATWSLGIIGLFASLIIGVFRTGRIKDGLKFIPFFVTLSVAAYFLVSMVLHNIVGSFV
jgi:pilus assembly protein TadC